MRPRLCHSRVCASFGKRVLKVAVLKVVTVAGGVWSIASGSMAIAATSMTERCRDFVIETWDSGDGMPANSATAMVQDAHGYLWFGTYAGLVRFDGARFEVFDVGNTPALPSSSVVDLHLDRAGRLWVSTLRGLAIREAGAWRTVGAAEGWTGDYVRSFVERADGSMVLSCFDTSLHEWRDDRFTRMADPPGAPLIDVVAADGDGRVWSMRSGFVGYWGDATGSIGANDLDDSTWHPIVEVSQGVAPLAVATAHDGDVWLVIGETIRKHDGAREVLRLDVPGLPPGIWSLSEDSAGNLWVSTIDAGVHRVDRAGHVTTWNRRNGLPSNSTRFVFEDRERNLWIGCEGGGLTRFRHRRAQAFGEELGIEDPVVRSVWPMRDGSIAVGSYGGGLHRLTDEAAEQRSLGSPNPIYVQSVREDGEGRLFVGAFGDGLFVVEDGESRRIELPADVGHNVIALFEDSSNRMWVSGGWSVAIVEDGSASVPAPLVGAPLGDVVVFAEDADGRILLSTREAVYRLSDDRLEELRHPDGRAIGQVVALRTERDGTVWMGTSGAGLLRWRADRVDVVDSRQGLPATAVYGILEDDDGYWWLGTNRGIVCVRRAELEALIDGRLARARWVTLGVADGMLSNECSGSRQPVCGVDAAGRLWFATPRGIAMVDPSTFRTNDLPPIAVVESVEYVLGGASNGSETLLVMDRDGEPQGGGLRGGVRGGTMTLPPGLGRMAIAYTAPSLSNPNAMRFETRLEGLDPDWRDVGNARLVEYYMPPPGRYRFHVRATNEDGVLSEGEASLSIAVMPFFWQTHWFLGSAAFTTIALCGGGVWLVTYRRYARRRDADLRFRRVVEAAPNAMIMVDASGQITLVNAQAEREFGYAPADLFGQPFELLLPERFHAAHRRLRTDLLERSPDRSTAHVQELFGRRKDGDEFPIELRLAQIRTRGGASVLASMVNLTDRQERERERAAARNELAHLSRVAVLGELSGALAHELNQPLTAILSNAQAAQRLLRRNPVDLPEIAEILGDIVDQDKRAGEVIRRLRELLRKGESDLRRLDLAELIHDSVRLLRSDLLGHLVDLKLAIEPGLPPVRGDRVQLQQVMLNLIVNAQDAMRNVSPAGRSITIAASRVSGGVGGGIAVSVRDRGPGIGAASIGRVFDPFYTTKATGLGLGLAICRSIIVAHGGQIVAHDHNNGDRDGGAEITFTLPESAATAEETE